MNVNVPAALYEELERSEQKFCWGTRRLPPGASISESITGYKYPMPLLENLLGGLEKLKTLRVLEVGSGRGFFLCYALKTGLDIVGIEPDNGEGFKGRRDWALKLLSANGIYNPEKFLLDATAESLPFPDEHFDAVISVAVLEHVSDLGKAMTEMLRVLKKGGMLWANLPNYSGCYEAHYNLPWIPHMPKKWAKKYVKMLGRDPKMLDEIHFTSPGMFKKYSTYGRVETYLYQRGMLNPLFAAYNCCRNDKLLPAEKTRHGGISGLLEDVLRNDKCRTMMRWPLATCVNILRMLSQSTVFDLIIYKNEVL